MSSKPKDTELQAEERERITKGKLKQTTPGVQTISGEQKKSERQMVQEKVENSANTRPGQAWHPPGFSQVKSKLSAEQKVPEPKKAPMGSGPGFNDPTGKRLAGTKGYDKVG